MSSGDPQASDSQPESPIGSSHPTDDTSVDKPGAQSVSSAEAKVEVAAKPTVEPATVAARGLGVSKPASPVAGPLAAKMKSRGGSAKPMGPSIGPFRPGKPGKPGKSAQSGPKGGPAKPGSPVSPAADGTADGTPAVESGLPSAIELENKADQAEQTGDDAKHAQAGYKPKVSVPNLRQPLSDDLQAELDAQLSNADVTSILSGPAGLAGRKPLEEGEKVRGKVIKIDDESVYVSLGGPDEGAVSRLQFDAEAIPESGAMIEVVVRGFNGEDGLYNLVIPGQAMDVSDWEDLEEGTVVEAHIAAANTGGLEATVGNIRGFIPISQIAQYRVEDATEFVGQRLMCLVTECNARRKNLVLSHRAILERQREEQRQEQLEKLEPGDVMEGTVRSVKDFGAFVDLGGLDGMIHVTKLSWDHIKHPSDVLEVGQKITVKVDKVDKQSGKIALSYRDLMENPWDTVESSLSVGSVATGTVTRLANFGAFVRLGAGIEGLVHISEVAGHRVSNVNSVLKEGEEVTVKVLSIERESQRIALSIKQAQSKAADASIKQEDDIDEPPREVAVKRQHDGPLKGGVGKESGGNQFGLNW